MAPRLGLWLAATAAAPAVVVEEGELDEVDVDDVEEDDVLEVVDVVDEDVDVVEDTVDVEDAEDTVDPVDVTETVARVVGSLRLDGVAVKLKVWDSRCRVAVVETPVAMAATLVARSAAVPHPNW